MHALGAGHGVRGRASARGACEGPWLRRARTLSRSATPSCPPPPHHPQRPTTTSTLTPNPSHPDSPPPHTKRFEELEYADAASYMEAGRIVFTGSPEQLRQRLRGMGATV
jgi:hypothetical protein